MPTYPVDTIQVLSVVEGVRKRPFMYLNGPTGPGADFLAIVVLLRGLRSLWPDDKLLVELVLCEEEGESTVRVRGKGLGHEQARKALCEGTPDYQLAAFNAMCSELVLETGSETEESCFRCAKGLCEKSWLNGVKSHPHTAGGFKLDLDLLELTPETLTPPVRFTHLIAQEPRIGVHLDLYWKGLYLIQGHV